MAAKEKKLESQTVLLVVTGGIAAYKVADLASKLTAAGSNVFTVMTQNACNFVGPKTFEAVTGNPVFTEMWSLRNEHEIGHISLSQQADVIIVAPATANIIAKMAMGICDDMASTTLAAGWNKPMFIAPAMNDNMWSNPAVQKNVDTLKSRNVKFIGPDTGRLACGTIATGRMSQPVDIIAAVTEQI